MSSITPSSPHWKRKADHALGSDDTSLENKQSGEGSAQTSNSVLVTENAAGTSKPQKRALESVAESACRRSKRLKGECASPVELLPCKRTRKPKLNKGKDRETGSTPSPNISETTLPVESETPKPLLRISTNVIRTWTRSSRYPVLLAQRRQKPNLWVDTCLAALDTPLDIIFSVSGASSEETAEPTQDKIVDCQEYLEYEESRWPKDIPSYNAVTQAQVDPEADVRVPELLRNEQSLSEKFGYIPPTAASLEDREFSCFEYAVHQREALYAADFGYEPPPTDVYIGDRMALLKCFERDFMFGNALRRGDMGATKEKLGISWQARWTIIVHGELSKEQRLYIAQHPQQFTMTERDVAIESVEEQARDETHVELTVEEKLLRHCAGRGWDWV